MTKARITKAWDTPPEDLPDFSDEDPVVLSSYLPKTFHVLWAAIVTQGWERAREVALGGREIYFVAQRRGTIIHLRYVRHRKGNYYCLHASVNGVKHKLAEVTELVCTSKTSTITRIGVWTDGLGD